MEMVSAAPAVELPGLAWLELLSVCGPAPASAYLKAWCPGRAGRRGTGRPATTGSPRSLVTAWPSTAQHSPAQHTPPAPHRHQDHRRWFKGDTGPGGRGWSTHHSTARTCGVLVCWCVVCPRPVCSRCWWWRCVGARHSRPGDWRRPWMLQTLFAAGRGAEKLADWAAAHG